MSQTEHDILESSGIATPTEALTESDGITVSGVALGEGDTTTGMSGKTTRWPADTLRDAADTLHGKPITKQLGEGHVGAESTDDGVQVSSNVPLEAKVGEVTDARYEDGVGIVWRGEVKDEAMAEKVEQGLAEVSPVVSRDIEPVDGEDGLYEASEIHGFRDLGLVANGAAPSNSIQPGGSAVAALSADALAQVFDEPAESGTDTLDDDPDGASTEGSDTSGDTMELNENEEELVAASRTLDDPAVIENEDAQRLNDNAELLSDAQNTDDPVILAESEHDGLTGKVESVRGAMEEALAERTDLKESTIEALEFDALCAEFENEDGELDAEALVQTPETGDTDDPEDEPNEALSGDDKDRIEQIDTKLSQLSHSLPDSRVDALREEACELAGEDEYDDALEVL